MRAVFQWSLPTRTLELGKRTLIMGVVNVTPDSFSDGGRFLDRDRAVEQAERLLADGADVIDIGGESTRPGARVDAGPPNPMEQSAGAGAAASPVTAEEELKRVIPVIVELKRRHPKILVSIDTYKSVVARAAVGAGAEIVNDVSGLRWDPAMAKTVAELKCGVVLMHMRGRPEEWRNLPPPGDVVLLVKRELKEWAERAILVGVRRERIVLDPGFGFGSASRKIIRSCFGSTNCRRPDFRCWWALPGNHSLDELWPTGLEKMCLLNDASTGRWPVKPL